MNDLALKYEYIIRLGHDIGRLAIPTAHADTFRALERSYAIIREKGDDPNSAEFLFDYAFYCGEVASNISHALFQFEKKSEGKLSGQDREDLDKIDHLLSKAKIEQIDEAIQVIEPLFARHGKII